MDIQSNDAVIIYDETLLNGECSSGSEGDNISRKKKRRHLGIFGQKRGKEDILEIHKIGISFSKGP